MLDRLDETIVAISSPPGHGALGIVRLSGVKAITIADQMTLTDSSRPLTERPGFTRVPGNVIIPPDLSLPAAFYVFRAPHSYTREDLVEVHSVGSPAALELIRRRMVSLGATLAGPGEFTARAFLNGAMDLTAAEAVAGIIRAQTDTQLRASRRMIDGDLASKITETRDALTDLVALVEADIDFAEEPIEFITPSDLCRRLTAINERLQGLLAADASAERFDVLPHILLFGPPNTGKSSLMNCLSGTPRAICAAAAGTTRDILSAPIRLGRREAILLDTAGLDSSDDEIIAQARANTLSATERVDLLCVVVDLTHPIDERLLEKVRSLDTPAVVIAANKCDLVAPEEAERLARRLQRLPLGPVCPVSALGGTRVEELRALLGSALQAAETTTLGEAVLISERQRSAIRNGLQVIQRAVSMSQTAGDTIDFAELLAFELRDALDALGSVTGAVTTDQLLEQVFANFCIGK